MSKKSSKKKLFSEDYELHVSAKMLYPYIQSAVGLADWVADKVTVDHEKTYTFEWENEKHKATISSQRINHSVRFTYLPESINDKKDPSYLEFRIEVNEITQSTYLKILDYSDFDDMVELSELWSANIEKLKSIIGG